MSQPQPHTHKPRTLIVAGGGSGGHIWPGVAIADQWKQKFGSETSVLFVGAKGGLEEILVPSSGYPLEVLKMGSLKGQGAFKILRTLLLLPFNFLKSLLILFKNRPDAVVGVGGYASGPFVLVAATIGKLLGVKTAIVEPNAAAGLTNRILQRFVGQVFSTFEPKEQNSNWHLTGYPIRSQIKSLPASEKDRLRIFAFGGSQGAVGMNTLLMNSIEELGGVGDNIEILHQTGKRDFQRIQEWHQKLGTGARVVEFVDDMISEYQKANLLICRAGASTLAEIAAVGRASILIPLPTAADNHQEMNARVFSDQGAAITILQNETDPEEFAEVIRRFAQDPAQLAPMEDSVRKLNRPHAASDVVDLLSGEKISR